MRSTCLACVFLIYFLVPVPSAIADVIAVFGTGVDGSGGLLPNGSNDPHFQLVQYPGQVGSTPAPAFVLNSLAFGYVPNGPNSKWISWSADLVNGVPNGVYVYRTTFDLTGLNYSLAVLTGRLASDDTATVFLNGQNTGVTSMSIETFVDFNLTSGFLPGINAVEVRVQNANFVSFNPTALRMDLSGTAPIPEPASLSLLGLSVVGVVALRRLCRRHDSSN